MSETTLPTTDWSARSFAVIVETSSDESLAGARRVQTVGHDVVDCDEARRTIREGGHNVLDESLDDYLRRNEFFDGEIVFDPPWPCRRCVSVVNVDERPLSEIAAEHGETEHLGPIGGEREPVAVEHDPREAEAIEFAKAYEGSFDFMVSMRAKCSKVVVRLSPKMIDAILRCKARAADPAAAGNVKPNRFAGSCGSCGNEVAEGAGRIEKVDGRWIVSHLDGACPPVASKAPESDGERRSAAPAPSVPAGRYAVETEDGRLAFYRVDVPTEGRWAGRTFVNVQASDELHPVKGEAGKAILRKIGEDPKAAMLRYGRELGHCGHCGRTLTDEDSRAAGIGPVCRAKVGW